MVKKVLFYSEAWGRGGIETFIRNVAPALVAAGMQVDIVSTWDWADADGSDLEKLGIRFYTAFHGYRPCQVRRLVCGLRMFDTLLRKNAYDAVWINTMNGVGMLYALAASRRHVPIRVVHSHNSDVGDGLKMLKRAVGKTASVLFGGFSTQNTACSREAGDYLFCGRAFDVLPNGIDIDRFRFSAEDRNRVRRDLGVNPSEVLIGNIGRVYSQKNPLFQVRVFAEYYKLNQASRYLMLGRQDMAKEVMSIARQLGVDDRLILRDAVENPAPYYSSLDAFLMPSLYEGFGFVKIEAQCSSLPVLCSDTMPLEADVTDLVERCSLSVSPREWAQRLYSTITASKLDGRDARFGDEVARAGYSLEACTSAVFSILQGEPR